MAKVALHFSPRLERYRAIFWGLVFVGLFLLVYFFFGLFGWFIIFQFWSGFVLFVLVI